MSSPHVQTLGAFLLRGRTPKYRAIKHIVPLGDGDRLVIHDDEPESWITGDRIAILFHGLCGCHGSPYMARTAEKLKRQGVRTFRVDMRGFGDSALISKSHLHGGYYPDVHSVVAFIHRLSPLSKLSLVGFSVGGNIVMKALGVWGPEAPEYVDSAVTVSPPVDLLHCSWNIRQFGNRIYENYFMKRFKKHLSMRRRRVKGLVDSGVNPLPNRLLHWDDQFTAPCWGYSGAKEYYQDASSGPQLHRVSVPTIILTSQDDPIVPFSMYSRFEMSEYIEMVVTKKGGHLGFMAQSRDPDRFWMDWRISQWIGSLDENILADSREIVPRPHRRQRIVTR